MEQATIAGLYLTVFLSAALPGPCAVITTSRTARHGISGGVRVTCGVMLGAALMMALAVAAIHGALTLAPGMILAVKWIGIVILTGLAVQMLRARPAWPGGTVSPGGGVIVGLLVVVTSPSVLIFLLAILPQFLPAAGVPSRGSVQTAAMMFLAGVLTTQIAAVALATAAPALPRSAGRWLNLAGGSILVAFAATATIAPAG